MTQHSIERIVAALNEARVRFLVVGGLAVVAHGFVRFTADIDLVLDPDPEALRRAAEVLAGLGYRPRASVALADFADAEKRREWVRDKGLAVFSLASPQHAATEVDLFVEPPFDFEASYRNAARIEVAAGRVATFVGLDELIRMKRSAGRPQDLQDVAELEALRRGKDEAR